jgi:hypothetical protein
MNKQFRKQIIDDFIAFATNDENRAELFVTNKKGVASTELRNNYRIILRSSKMDELFKEVVKSVRVNKKSQGFLYFLHQVDDRGNAYPLYLGIARRKGKSNEISSLFNGNYPRWDYYKNGNYHLSNLNSVVFKEGYTEQDRDKCKGIYLEWAKGIFTNADFPIEQGEELFLHMPLYLSLIELNEHRNSFVKVLGNITIKCEESVLINLLYEFYPEKLLNKDI